MLAVTLQRGRKSEFCLGGKGFDSSLGRIVGRAREVMAYDLDVDVMFICSISYEKSKRYGIAFLLIYFFHFHSSFEKSRGVVCVIHNLEEEGGASQRTLR